MTTNTPHPAHARGCAWYADQRCNCGGPEMPATEPDVLSGVELLDALRDPETCAHIVITTFGDGENGPSLWACEDCRLRFYPACRTCVDVGHRNIERPAARSVPVTEDGLARLGRFSLDKWLVVLRGARLATDPPEPRDD